MLLDYFEDDLPKRTMLSETTPSSINTLDSPSSDGALQTEISNCLTPSNNPEDKNVGSSSSSCGEAEEMASSRKKDDDIV